MKPLGFIISSILYLFGQIVILCPKEKYNFVMFAIVSVVTSVVVFYTFRKGLNLMLPVGILKFLS
jgi:putative tricarboxylic transport membrane protein